MSKARTHYSLLLFIVFLGTGLRFWRLDSKPLWLDEVITALFVTGHGYEDIPTRLSWAELPQLFAVQPKSCSEIAHYLLTQSTHPPAFFCLLHGWLTWLAPLNMEGNLNGSLTWQLRALPALFGVGTILMLYFLNRLAFSRLAGLLGAGIMAISPFGIYLAQEARHYTIATLFTSIALFLLVQIQKDWQKKRQRVWLWLLWGVVNGLGLYVHYFYLLVLNAQVVALVGIVSYSHILNRNKQFARQIRDLRFNILIPKPKRQLLLVVTISYLLPLLIFLPWLPAFFHHFQSPGTDWLPSPQNIAPLYQTLVAWILMVVALPVEDQPLALQVISVLLGISIGIWIYWQGLRGLKRQNSQQLSPLFLLIVFTLAVTFEFFLIIYGLGKDISIAPRYSFVYFPSLCALLGYGLSNLLKANHQGVKKLFLIFLIGMISSLLVTENLVFLKPFAPEKVATHLTSLGQSADMILVSEQTSDLALGLSYALTVKSALTETFTFTFTFTFVSRQAGYETTWQEIAQFAPSSPFLWLIIPRGRQVDFPESLEFIQGATCISSPQHFFRVGSPHQLYRCKSF